jgi:glutathione S-transferase
MTLKLFELCGSDPARNFSAYCWRTRMALAHKELEYERLPWRYKDAGLINVYGSKTVPVLLNDGEAIFDSWVIANYLETTYPDRPSLFGGEGGRALAKFVNSWVDASVATTLFPMIAADVASHLGPEDAAYFRKTREARLGRTLEAARDARDENIASFRKLLDPVRLTLTSQPYLGGHRPNYGDYILFSVFQWSRTISAFKLLADDDPICAWRTSLSDAFDGMARRAIGYDV